MGLFLFYCFKFPFTISASIITNTRANRITFNIFCIAFGTFNRIINNAIGNIFLARCSLAIVSLADGGGVFGFYIIFQPSFFLFDPCHIKFKLAHPFLPISSYPIGATGIDSISFFLSFLRRFICCFFSRLS